MRQPGAVWLSVLTPSTHAHNFPGPPLDTTTRERVVFVRIKQVGEPLMEARQLPWTWKLTQDLVNYRWISTSKQWNLVCGKVEPCHGLQTSEHAKTMWIYFKNT